MQDKLIVRIVLLDARGHELRGPHADTLRNGIHERRVVSQRVNYRVRDFSHGRKAAISHGLAKARAVPPREIELAVERRRRSREPEKHEYRRRVDHELPERGRHPAPPLRRRRCRAYGSVERERVNAEVAQIIYDHRTAAGLTQKQFAERVGTRQSVISRLEDADYGGHSLSMLQRVAEALGRASSSR